MKTLLTIAIIGPIALAAAGCRYLEENGLLVDAKSETSDTATFGSGPEKVWIDKAKENYRKGEYGLAERYFRQAVEEQHNNVEAWLGLAASYDRLKRFDEADRAYKIVTKMAGNTPAVLNNLGYHYMLKGEFDSAEHALRAAQEQDPTNPYIQNNLVLLGNWKTAAGRNG